MKNDYHDFVLNPASRRIYGGKKLGIDIRDCIGMGKRLYDSFATAARKSGFLSHFFLLAMTKTYDTGKKCLEKRGGRVIYL